MGNLTIENNGGIEQVIGAKAGLAAIIAGKLSPSAKFPASLNSVVRLLLLNNDMKKLFTSLIILALASFSSLAQEKTNDNYLRLAEQGDAVAQNELGVRIAQGIGTKPNNRVATEWFRKSAEQGNALGACNLGLHYARGAGIRKNLVVAFKWFYVANSLDGLKCHPSDYSALFKPRKAQDKKAWKFAVAWLRAHPELKNDFDQRPWLEGKPPSNKSLERRRKQLHS